MPAIRRTVLATAIAMLAVVPAASAAGASGAREPALTGRDRILASWAAHEARMRARAHPHPALAFVPNHAASPSAFGTLKRVKQVSQDTLPPAPGSEPDTQIEPDVAMDPNHPNIVVGTFQQGRFPDGGSVDPGFATSLDGGKTWTAGNLPHLTQAVGGVWERASDPAVAFGPDGSVYITTLPFNMKANGNNGVAVQRSDDHGLTWTDPFMVQSDPGSVGDDKNWIAVDTFAGSPHLGRVYVAWDRATGGGQPIVLRYSDDRGQTWSALKTLSGSVGIGAQPVVLPNGDLAMIYEDFGTGDKIVARLSTDGGKTFGPTVTIGTFRGGGPPDERTGGLPSATVDPTTGALYVVWQDVRFRSDGLDDIVISTSTDEGAHWSALARVNQDATTSGLDHFTPDVAAYGGFVHVAYLVRAKTGGHYSNLVDERYIVSADGGSTFGGELVVGGPSDLTYAATAGGKFLGDYQGITANANVAHPIWCRSFAPPPRATTYHQTAWSAAVKR